MRLETRVEPPYLPDPNQDTVLHLGLRALDPRQWMQRDADYPQFLAHKQQVLRDHADKVYFTLTGSEAAQEEFHQLLVRHLVEDHELGQLSEKTFTSLWESSLLIQEDICLLERETKDNKNYHLTAASVCSPSNWKLEEKINADLDKIHRPVPGYAAELGGRVNRLFTKLKSNAPLLRYNWSVQNGNELFWRGERQPEDFTTEPLWYWRVERQTLLRMPDTQAIVFGIRIYLHELEALSHQPEFKAQLRDIARRLPAEQQHYKGLARWLQQ